MGHKRKLFWDLQGSRCMQDRSICKDRVLVGREIKAGAIWSKQANATWEKCVEHAPTRTWYSWNQVVQFQKTSASTTDIHTAMKYPTLAQHGFIENDKLWGNSTEGWLHLFEVFGRAYLSSSWPARQPWQRLGVSRSSNLRQLPGVLHGTHRLSQAMPRESCWNVDVFNFFKLKADIQWYSDFCSATLVKCHFFLHPFQNKVNARMCMRWKGCVGIEYNNYQHCEIWTKWDWLNSDQYLCRIDTVSGVMPRTPSDDGVGIVKHPKRPDVSSVNWFTLLFLIVCCLLHGYPWVLA